MCVRVGRSALVGYELAFLDGDGLRFRGCGGGGREDVVFVGEGEKSDEEGGMEVGVGKD